MHPTIGRKPRLSVTIVAVLFLFTGITLELQRATCTAAQTLGKNDCANKLLKSSKLDFGKHRCTREVDITKSKFLYRKSESAEAQEVAAVSFTTSPDKHFPHVCDSEVASIQSDADVFNSALVFVPSLRVATKSAAWVNDSLCCRTAGNTGEVQCVKASTSNSEIKSIEGKYAKTFWEEHDCEHIFRAHFKALPTCSIVADAVKKSPANQPPAKNCLTFQAESKKKSRGAADRFGLCGHQPSHTHCFSDQEDQANGNIGRLVSRDHPLMQMLLPQTSPGNLDQAAVAKIFATSPDPETKASACCRLAKRTVSDLRTEQTPAIICGPPASLADLNNQIVSQDRLMGLPPKLNANGCFNFLNGLSAEDHTLLVVRELEDIYTHSSSPGKFHQWIALILWSIFRASDEFLQLQTQATEEMKRNYGYMLVAKQLDELTLADLQTMIEGARKHTPTVAVLNGQPSCRRVAFFLNLVLEGRYKRSRVTMKRWQQARFAMQVIGQALKTVGGVIPVVGEAANAVVSIVDGILEAKSGETEAALDAKTTVLETFVALVDGALRTEPNKELLKAVIEAAKIPQPPRGGGDFLELQTSTKRTASLTQVTKRHRLSRRLSENSSPPAAASVPDQFLLESRGYPAGDCSAQIKQILDLFYFLFVQGETKRVALDDGINKCHAKFIDEKKSINSWKSMIRLHKQFVDAKWPSELTSTDDAGGRLARAANFFGKISEGFTNLYGAVLDLPGIQDKVQAYKDKVAAELEKRA